MKILEFQTRIMKHQNHRIPCEKHDNLKNHITPKENKENHKNIRIPFENHENN